MAQPRSKEQSTRKNNGRLKQREPGGKKGRAQHHTRKNMERPEASQSGEVQKSRRSSTASTKPRNEPSDQGSNLGNLAQSIADRPGSILLAAAAVAGTFLMSRWFAENGWLRHSFRRDGNGKTFIPGGNRVEAQLPTNRNEANTEPAQHSDIDRGGVVSDVGFEMAYASQQNAVTQAGDQSGPVEETPVFDLNGQQIGTIRRLIIAKVGGRVLYAITKFGGLLGIDSDEYAIPWSKLEYDTTLGGYRTEVTHEQLQNAPEFSQDQHYDRSKHQSQGDLRHYYEVPITEFRP